MKKSVIISALLCLCMSLYAQEPNVIKSGTLGEDNITYTRYSNGLLTFTGSGRTGDFRHDEIAGWCDRNKQVWLFDSETEATQPPVTEVVFGEGITEVGYFMFFDCGQDITSVTLASTIERIGGLAFYEAKITSINFPASLKRVEAQAFASTTLAGDVVFPEGLKSFHTSAFMNARVTSIHIPSTVDDIQGDGNNGSSSITQITVHPDNAKYDSRDNCNGIVQTSNNVLVWACKNTTIPVSVTGIEYTAFRNAEWQTSIDLSATNVSYIGDGAFWECTNLREMHFPESTTRIGENFFGPEAGVRSLKRIYIGSQVTDMRNAFVTFGHEDTKDSDLPALTDFYVSAKTPPLLEENNFKIAGARRNVILHVRPGCINIYRNALGWKNFDNIVGDYIIPENNEAHFALYDTQNYTSDATIMVDELTYTRTFNNNKWQALYVPFAMDFDDWDAVGLEVARITNFHQYDRDGDGEADTQECEIIKQTAGCSTIPSYPYFVRAKEAGEKTITVQNATLYAAEDLSVDCSSVDWSYVFTGNYSSRAMGPSAYDDYTHEFALSGGILKYAEQTVTLNPFRWTLRIYSRLLNSTVSPQRIIVRLFNEEDEYADIDNLPMNDSEKSVFGGKVYSVEGLVVGELKENQSIKDLNLPAGIYISNGQKLFVP